METNRLKSSFSKWSTLTALAGLARLSPLGLAAALMAAQPALADNTQILPSPTVTVSTIPANANVNPYSVAFVPNNFSGRRGS